MPICENEFCIYQKNNTCSLGEVNHDEHGMCVDCILLPIPDPIIEKMKQAKEDAWAETRAQCGIEDFIARAKNGEEEH